MLDIRFCDSLIPQEVQYQDVDLIHVAAVALLVDKTGNFISLSPALVTAPGTERPVEQLVWPLLPGTLSEPNTFENQLDVYLACTKESLLWIIIL